MPGPVVLLSVIMVWGALGKRYLPIIFIALLIVNLPTFVASTIVTYQVVVNITTPIVTTVAQVNHAIQSCGVNATDACISKAVAPLQKQIAHVDSTVSILEIFDLFELVFVGVLFYYVKRNVNAVRRRLALRRRDTFYLVHKR